MYVCMYVFISSPEELIFSLVLEKRRETPAGGGTRNLGPDPGPGPGSNRDLVALGMLLHAAESPRMIFFFFFLKVGRLPQAPPYLHVSASWKPDYPTFSLT